MDAQEVLRRAAVFFAERGHSYEIWTRTGVDDDLENAAMAVGMRFAAELTGMVIHRKPELPECAAGVELRQVQDIQGVRDFTNVAADGFLRRRTRHFGTYSCHVFEFALSLGR